MIEAMITGVIEAENRFGYKPIAIIMSKGMYLQLNFENGYKNVSAFLGIPIIITAIEPPTPLVEFVGKPQDLLTYVFCVKV